MKLGRILAIVGGALAVVAVFLPRFTGLESLEDLAELDGETLMQAPAGVIFLVLGMISIALGALALARGSRLWMGIIEILVSLAILLLALAIRASDSSDLELLSGLGIEGVEMGVGPLVALGGGVLALLGGVLMLKRGARNDVVTNDYAAPADSTVL